MTQIIGSYFICDDDRDIIKVTNIMKGQQSDWIAFEVISDPNDFWEGEHTDRTMAVNSFKLEYRPYHPYNTPLFKALHD